MAGGSAVTGCLAPRPAWIATGRCGMVATDSKYASQAGLEVLRAGGNAADAAAAVSFALGVVRPYSTGPGGGGFMILRLADGEAAVLDYRETAPAAATADMFIRAARRDASRNGYLAVGVPGMVAGQTQALERFGTLPLASVLAPAIHLARDGFPLDAHHVEAIHDALKQYAQNPDLTDSCEFVYHEHLGHGQAPRLGDTLRQPALAEFLERLADEGPDFFYHGDFARSLDDSMVRAGGIVRVEDLAAYRVRQRTPLVGTYRDWRIISMPPPSSGGVALVQTLHILESFHLPELHRRDPALAAHYLTEAMKHAFADRARWLADTDFVPVPVDHLMSRDYAAQIAAGIGPHASADLDGYGSTQLPEDAGTSHFCVADRFGNLVVCTETINTAFGALAAVDEWGVILNNEMDDFTADPGRPNAYELTQSQRNAVAPHKRPLSSMTPTIVLRGNQPYMLLGASGGPRIISSVLNVLVNVLDFDMPLDRAMNAPRVHHQWLPDEICFDQPPPASLAAALTARGHHLSDTRKTGIVQAILHRPDGWTGASDPRKGGQPAGY